MKRIPVSERALVARIVRAMAKDSRTLKRCREDSRWFRDLGRYYSIDVAGNYIVGKDHNLEELGREMGALQAFEFLAEA